MNVDLAERAIRVARDNPEQFDMDDWVTGNYDGFTKDSADTPPPCGTTACFAGWVSFLAAPVGSSVIGARVYLPDGRHQHVGDYAQEALGISDEQEDVLFYLDNLDQVERAVNHLASNPGANRESLRRATRG